MCPCALTLRFESSPESEGIKTSWVSTLMRLNRFESSPESEGIKTYPLQFLISFDTFESSPESEGIKTRHACLTHDPPLV